MNLIKDALYYTRLDSGASVEKAQGVVIGVVSVIMSERRLSFDETIRILLPLMPDEYRIDTIPDAWRECFTKGNR